MVLIMKIETGQELINITNKKSRKKLKELRELVKKEFNPDNKKYKKIIKWRDKDGNNILHHLFSEVFYNTNTIESIDSTFTYTEIILRDKQLSELLFQKLLYDNNKAQKSPLTNAINYDNKKITSSLLYYAINNGKDDLVQDLCSNQHIVAIINRRNRYGNTLLHHAITLERTEIVKYLVAAGADLNIKNKKQYTPSIICSSHFKPKDN